MLPQRELGVLLAFGASLSCVGPVSGSEVLPLGRRASLAVSPQTGGTFEGSQGGPFRPDAYTFTLLNEGGSDLRWKLDASEAWLRFEGPAEGVLRPRASVSVRVTVATPAAAALSAGAHTGVVRFLTPDEPSDVEVRNVSLEIAGVTVGWTEFAASTDTRKVYVSSSSGNDADDGLTESKPKRTIAAAREILRHGQPDWLLLKRGDVWQESLGQWKKSGRSQSEPMLVSSYGDAAARPLLQTGAKGGVWTNGGGASPATIDNVAIVGLHFHADDYTGTGECIGAQLLQPSSHLLIEDCEFQGYGTNLVFQGFGGRHNDIRLRRSVVVDAYSVHGKGNHPQGLYAYGVDGLVIEENVFDHNGWNESVSGAGADIYSHNLYIDNGNTGVVVRGNTIADAASHGLQLRCGGAVVNNLFLRNSIALSVGGGNDPEPAGVTADVRGNVILEGKNIDEKNPRGWGMWFGNIASGRVAHNVIANNSLGSQPFALVLDGDDDGKSNHGIGVHHLVIEGNVLSNWGGSLRIEGNADQITDIDLARNDIQELATNAVLVDHVDPSSVASVRSTGNRFYSRLAPAGAWMRVAGKELPLPAAGRTTEVSAPINAPIQYPHPNRCAAFFADALGATGTCREFVTQARAQSRASWRPAFTAVKVNRYVKEGLALGID